MEEAKIISSFYLNEALMSRHANDGLTNFTREIFSHKFSI